MERSTGLVALAITFVLLVALGCAGQVSPAETAVVTPSAAVEAAALVNGRPIAYDEYAKAVPEVDAYFAQQGLDPQSDEGRETLSQAHRQILEQMIEQELIRQAAEGMGVSISQDEVEASIQDIIGELGGQEEFNEYLGAMGASDEEYRQMLLDQLLSNAVYDAVTASISPVAEQVHARHILLPTRQGAEEVLARLEAGEDFAYLAREYTEDISSREMGGDVGFFPRGVMPPEVEEVAFALDVGQVSEIVESQFGFHIIQVLEKEEREIAVEVFENLRQQTFMEWLQQRKEESTIERFVD